MSEIKLGVAAEAVKVMSFGCEVCEHIVVLRVEIFLMERYQ
jgi:hypothetical protein